MQNRAAASTPPVRVALAIIVHNSMVLIGHRPPGVRLAGFWEFPGGKLEPDETPAACAVREAREECGLEVCIAQELPPILREDDDLTVELLPFVCEVKLAASSSAKPDLREAPPVQAAGTSQLQWVPISRLREFRFPPANDELMVHIERLFGGVKDAGAS